MGKKHRKKVKRENTAAMLVAFGVGLFIALVCSLKLALFIAAAAIIYLGFLFISC